MISEIQLGEPKTGPAHAVHAGYRNPMPATGSANPYSTAFRQQHLLTSIGLVRASWYSRVKPVFDCVLGVAFAFLLSPVILATGILVKLTSPGPAFYSQTRLGRFAHPFRIVKFRSMNYNCESKSGVKWASRNDTRVTPIGKFIRITHLDELPQLINILRGEMSLVGPRPERPEFIPALEKTVPNYRMRMLVKPGVSGLAQVYLPPDVDVTSVQKKVVYDLYYIRHLSFWLDVRLLVATPLQALGMPCSLVRRLLLLPSIEKIEGEAMLTPEFEGIPTHDVINPAYANPTPHDVDAYTISDSKYGSSVAV